MHEIQGSSIRQFSLDGEKRGEVVILICPSIQSRLRAVFRLTEKRCTFSDQLTHRNGPFFNR